MNETTLADLAPGERGKILGITGKGMLGQRLVDMGLYPGAAALVVRRAPLGDPIEVRVRGYDLSLRKEDAGLIEVE